MAAIVPHPGKSGRIERREHGVRTVAQAFGQRAEPEARGARQPRIVAQGQGDRVWWTFATLATSAIVIRLRGMLGRNGSRKRYLFFSKRKATVADRKPGFQVVQTGRSSGHQRWRCLPLRVLFLPVGPEPVPIAYAIQPPEARPRAQSGRGQSGCRPVPKFQGRRLHSRLRGPEDEGPGVAENELGGGREAAEGRQGVPRSPPRSHHCRSRNPEAGQGVLRRQRDRRRRRIATVKNEGRLFETFDYTNPEDRAKIKEIVTATAKAFDEFILDDFFFTSSKSASAIAQKGDRSWTDFRLELMTEVSRDLVLDVARSVNPKVKVIIKYPNWYEHFQGVGYNLEVQPKIFDEIYTGTETRDSVYNAQHLSLTRATSRSAISTTSSRAETAAVGWTRATGSTPIDTPNSSG